jgi:sulfur-carrier protein adenylyltransferase/sulfurtransferase
MTTSPHAHHPSPVAPDAPELSADELQRYSRHLLLPEVGEDGQRRLKRASVLCVGAGGLGSPVALYLAAAGVGRLGLVDFDRVDASNLQRQLLHGTADVGRRKTDSARDRLHDLNPHVHVETYDEALTSANAMEILGRYDVVVDGTDNFQTRYLTNDACVLLGVPNVYGSVLRFEGQASVFSTPDGPCYRCLFREPPPPGMVPSCAEGGVLGVLPGLIGTIQATETIKLLLGVGTTLAGRLLLVDALRMQFRTIELRRDPECPACGTREIKALIDYDEFCGTARATEAEPEAEPAAEPAGPARGEVGRMTPVQLAARQRAADAPHVIDVREPYELRVAPFAGAQAVPLGQFADAATTFDVEREVVLLCHHGMRSLQAARFLAQRGFRRVWNLEGGIDRWSAEVDPTVRRY